MNQQPTILKDLKEVCIHGTKSFPCAIYRTHAAGRGVFVKHHWHDEVEILYFSGGAFRLEINMESFPIRSECFYFVNPGELHGIFSETAECHWEDAVVFAPGILGFESGDEVQIRLIKPIQNGKLLFPRCVTPQHPAFSMLRSAFVDIMRAFGQRTEEAFAGQEEARAPLPDSSLVTDDLTSQMYVRSSLIEYINEYRIKQAKRLLDETSLQLTEVCLECGFTHLGNFLQEFRKHTRTTPLQYRKHMESL